MSLNTGLVLLSGAVVSYMVLEFSRKQVVSLLYVSPSLESKAALMLLQVGGSQVGGQTFFGGLPRHPRTASASWVSPTALGLEASVPGPANEAELTSELHAPRMCLQGWEATQPLSSKRGRMWGSETGWAPFPRKQAGVGAVCSAASHVHQSNGTRSKLLENPCREKCMTPTVCRASEG